MSCIEPRLFHGDAATVLRERVITASVDMIYLDPPFGNGLEWIGRRGRFSDRHKFDQAAKSRLASLQSVTPHAASFLSVAPVDEAMRAYLAMMAEMIVELRRVLRPTGSIWLHCDDTAGAYLRMLLSMIFGPETDLGQVVWKRTSAHSHNTARFGRVHDNIFVFARSRATRWRLWRIGGEFVWGDPLQRVGIAGFADDQLNPASKERVGYPTQKPISLVERFITDATLEGDLVLDPVCGSGTALLAARKCGCRSIGIDASEDALAVARERIAGGSKPAKNPAPQAAPESLPLFAGAA